MSDFDPDAYLADKSSDDFDPDEYLGTDAPAPKSVAPAPERGFLDYLKSRFAPSEPVDVGQAPGVKTIQTPTGSTHLDAQGRPVLTPEESGQMADANEAKFRERILEGGLSFLSGGGTMMDEMRGLNAIGDPRQFRKGESAGDTYHRVQNQTRNDVTRSTRNASPVLNIGTEQMPVLPMLGAMAPSIIAPMPAGSMARILGGTATAGIDQIGRSESDLSGGDVSGFVGDVGNAAKWGAGFSGAGEALAAPMRMIGRGAATRAGEAAKALEEANAKAAGKAVKSAVGTLGGVTAGGINSLEWLDDVLANPAKYTAEDIAAAQAFAAKPEIAAIRSNALQGNLDKLGRFVPALDDARAGLETANAAASPASIATKTAGQLDPSTAMADWGEKAWNSVGQRAVGSAAGGAVGAGVDMLMGNEHHQGGLMGIGAGAMSAPGMVQFMRNTKASPIMQNMAARGLSGVADLADSAVSKTMRSTALGVQNATPSEKAVEAQQEAFQLLAQRFGINAKSREELANEAFVRGQTP